VFAAREAKYRVFFKQANNMAILPDMSQRQRLRPFWAIIREGAHRRKYPVVFQSCQW
jgi:hypothetical protein